jgi:hypothetical protein
MPSSLPAASKVEVYTTVCILLFETVLNAE